MQRCLISTKQVIQTEENKTENLIKQKTIGVLNNRGLAYYQKSQFDLARKDYEEALRIIKDLNSSEKIDEVIIINNLAEVYASLGSISKATNLYILGIEILSEITQNSSKSRETGNNLLPRYFPIYNGLGNCYEFLG